ncbi:Inner membrane transport protein YhaO [Rodentibacter pneumotropicus]|uniref:Inner membrane transport protein YhaO n=1 Tax=Rodentibacter pneumotropicus TaxID=758 RepID=A0A448MTE8_9PAST|nr:Inner membrane transport protein YhaO [Rodentibacter pneumotropicus]
MLIIWMFVYSTAITNDSASYLYTFGVTDTLLSENPFYGLILICILVAISSRGENYYLNFPPLWCLLNYLSLLHLDFL